MQVVSWKLGDEAGDVKCRLLLRWACVGQYIKLKSDRYKCSITYGWSICLEQGSVGMEW